jgi:hypothetical protein
MGGGMGEWMVRAELLWLVSVAAYLISRRFFCIEIDHSNGCSEGLVCWL